MSRRMVRPNVDLPQPDSPTMPKVSPSSPHKLTPSTALTAPLLREKSPSPTGKCFLRSRISNRLIAIRTLILCTRPQPGLGKMAGDKMILLFFYQLRLRISAQPGGFGAAVPDSTAARKMQRARDDSRDGVQALFLFVSRARQRIEQTHRVGMKGSREDGLRARWLKHLTRIHDRDLVGLFRHDTEIVSNQ